ncbi:hypothetical protein L0F63_003813, partial [Massospora cicadina]
MGGKEILEKLAARMYRYNAMDHRISHFFDIGMMAHFEQMFVAFLTGLLGGKPYNRKGMIYCHQRIELGDFHFDAFLENLTLAMRHEVISQGIIDSLMALIELTRDDVCGRSKIPTSPVTPTQPNPCPFKQTSPNPEKYPPHKSKARNDPALCPC